MPNIIARNRPNEGDEFVVRTSLLAKVSSAFSIIFGGKRIGLARVEHDFSHDEKYTVELCGGQLESRSPSSMPSPGGYWHLATCSACASRSRGARSSS